MKMQLCVKVKLVQKAHMLFKKSLDGELFLQAPQFHQFLVRLI
jgi:hypothetical protein